MAHSRCSVNVSVPTQKIVFGNVDWVSFSLSNYLRLALPSFISYVFFSFYRIMLVLYIVIEAYTLFSSEYILVECSFQISKCSQYFIVIDFLSKI